MSTVAEMPDVAKKKVVEAPKRYGTLIRVSDEFAKALRRDRIREIYPRGILRCGPSSLGPQALLGMLVL